MLIFVPEDGEFLSPRNVGCFVILFYYLFVDLYLVFQLSCSILVSLYTLFLVHSRLYYMSQCIFLLSMWFTLLLPILSWYSLFLSLHYQFCKCLNDTNWYRESNANLSCELQQSYCFSSFMRYWQNSYGWLVNCSLYWSFPNLFFKDRVLQIYNGKFGITA